MGGTRNCLKLPLETVRNHLQGMIKLGVIHREDGMFSLDETAIKAFRNKQLHKPRRYFDPPDWLSPEDARIIRQLADLDGSLKRLPKQFSHWMAVTRYLTPVFEPGVDYTKKRVNALLMRYNIDTAVLRRFLVDTGVLKRQSALMEAATGGRKSHEHQENELVDFFKALADPSRLKIVGLLTRKPCTVEELAAMLDLRASTISHHLAFLKHIGLVSARAEGYYSVYQLEEKALQEKSKRLLSVPRTWLRYPECGPERL